MKKNKNWSLRVFSQSPILLTVAAIFGFLISLVFFYPGYRSPDSEWQLCQAVGDCMLNNWHPVSMALSWKALISLTGGFVPAMLIFQLLMFWAGVLLVSFWVWRKTGKWQLAILPLLLGFLPNIFNIIGVIWKDIQMASALLLGTGIILNTHDKNKWIRIFGIVTTLGLLVYAVSVRSNAIAAVLPLVVLFVFCYKWPEKYYQKILIIITVCSALVLVNPLLNRLYQPEYGPSSSTMYAYDIVNILPASRVATEAPENIRGALLAFSSCSLGNLQRTNLAFWACIDQEEVKKVFDEEGVFELKSYWRQTVTQYPLQYIAQKIETYAQFVFSGDGQGIWTDGGEVFSSEGSFSREQSFLSKSLRSVNYGYTIDFGYKYFPFLFKPWFWLLAAGAIMICSRGLKRYKKWVYGLSTSAIIYILSYAPGSLTPDYRYIYWSVIAVLVAGIIVLVSRNKRGTTKG